MNILLLNYEYPPIGGGAGVMSKKLVDYLIKRKHTVTVVTMGAHEIPHRDIQDGVVIIRTRNPKKYLFRTTVFEAIFYVLSGFFEVVKLRKSFKFDIIHAHFILPTGPLAYIFSKVYKIPYIITAHGSDIPNHSEDKVVFLHKFTKPILKLIVKNSYMTVVPSVSLKNELITNVRNFENIKIIGNGIEKDIFAGVSIADKKNLIISVARLGSEKGIDDAVAAYSKIDNSQMRDWSYEIIGDGPYRNKLELLASKSKNKIIFRGWIPYMSSRYISVYKEGAIMVLPSYTESFSMSLLEAMMNKCAIIASNIPPLKKLLGECALFVEPGNVDMIKKHLELLMKSPNERRRLGKKAYRRARKTYTTGILYAEYDKLFIDAINSYGKS